MNIPASNNSSTESLSSFSSLFGRAISGITISEIEIPLIQRDYAQGRPADAVKRIRDEFIKTLYQALLPGNAPADLDFVFGDVEKSGKFYPLDGQQRLTTLFLLHCYLAWRTGICIKDQAWSNFTYATRPSSREFCKFLVNCKPDFSTKLNDWIIDQAGFLPTWHYDPSIQSMLTVLQALHHRFSVENTMDFSSAWNRLMDRENPAIRFHVLPMKANNLTDKLYVKMNSRGKPLTPFENFKAQFEALLKEARHEGADDFTMKLDTDWTDSLWEYSRKNDHVIDDRFMRYFRFITEINAWKAKIKFKNSIRDDDLAKEVYERQATNSVHSVQFMFQALDIWTKENIVEFFVKFLSNETKDDGNTVKIFNAFKDESKEETINVDLFHGCCRYYGSERWSFAHTLLLYGVLLHKIHTTENFPRRLRILRNLIAASENEIRGGENGNMGLLLADTETVISSGDMSKIKAFNQLQVENEIQKADMLLAAPELEAVMHKLEDHDLLRGGLTVFDLTPNNFNQRAKAFLGIFEKSHSGHTLYWMDLTAALLTQADYARRYGRSSGYRLADLGSSRNAGPWRDLFRSRKQEIPHTASAALMALLDKLAVNGASMQSLIQEYLQAATTQKDWRYYMVKYEKMRIGASGRYAISDGHGYEMCMLDKGRMSSYYYDPYLLSIVEKSRILQNRIASPGWPCGFSGYESAPRYLILKNSGLRIRAVRHGWEISDLPENEKLLTELDKVCELLKIETSTPKRQYYIAQVDGVDAEDRMELGAELLLKLVEAGL